MLVIWLVLVFVLGAVVGSFVNVCVYRLPLEKSVFWPGSRCGHCFQKIRWYDNIPLVSYWVLRGRCRVCKTRFSPRYLLVELLTACSFAALFYLEVVVNVNSLIYDDWKPGPVMATAGMPRQDTGPLVRQQRETVLRFQRLRIAWGSVPWRAWVTFGYHAILISLLITVTFCDLDRRLIPTSVTVPGTIVGLIGATLLPWPWPASVEAPLAGMPAHEPWWQVPPQIGPQLGLYPWPVWGPLPEGLAPGGNWQTGLATGLAGMLAGTLVLRTVRALFSRGLGVEALGLGDADLMMMAGAFLGWQPVVVAFLVAVLPALVMGVIQLAVFGDNSLPFGPSLAIGVVLTWLSWHWLGPHVQVLFFYGPLMLALAGGCCVFMLAAGYLFRMARLARGGE
jgi:leader peptidase (prepilin peptidase)/N-methyltransferase